MKTLTITITIILITIFGATPVHPLIYMNYFCNTLTDCKLSNSFPNPNPPADDYTKNTADVSYLEAKAASTFFAAQAEFQLFLSKVEMIEVSPVNYPELNNHLKQTLIKLIEAESLYNRLFDASSQYNVNPNVLENLKNFDYKRFCAKQNLNSIILDEVEYFLSSGDIFSILENQIDSIAELRSMIKDFKKGVENQRPDFDAMYQINQKFLSMSLFGQYAAQIFREVRIQ